MTPHRDRSPIWQSSAEELTTLRAEMLTTSVKHMAQKYHITQRDILFILGPKPRVSVNQDFLNALDIPEEFERLKAEYLSIATDTFANRYRIAPGRLIKIFGKKETYRLATGRRNPTRTSKKKREEREKRIKDEEDIRRTVDRTRERYYWEDEIF